MGLREFRVLDFSTQIAGPYCSKLFVDAGAEVIKVERPEGDPLRRWSATGADLRGLDSALFAFLNAGKQSVVGTRRRSPRCSRFSARPILSSRRTASRPTRASVSTSGRLRAAHPSLVVLSITPVRAHGPLGRAPGHRVHAPGRVGLDRHPRPDGPGAVPGWRSHHRVGRRGLRRRRGVRRLCSARARPGAASTSICRCWSARTCVFANFSETMNRLLNGSPADPQHAFLAPSVETPSIEPTADGYVGFCTNARQQFSDFLLMIERPDLQADEQLVQFAGRLMRFAEWNEIMRAWLSKKTTAEVLELRVAAAHSRSRRSATERRVLAHEQLVARGVFGPDADATLRPAAPALPYRRPRSGGSATRSAPGADTRSRRFHEPAGRRSPAAMHGALPLAGPRVLDLTAWWAGPAATHLLATFGAEVIHIESTTRLDGLRTIGGMMATHYQDWWEASPHFLHANTNKLAITLDLTKPRGLELLERLIAKCDAVVENFTPRVLEGFGLGWERVRELNPRAILMRMPAFGLSGPWRDNTGFAQTMEQFSGLAWVTGHARSAAHSARPLRPDRRHARGLRAAGRARGAKHVGPRAPRGEHHGGEHAQHCRGAGHRVERLRQALEREGNRSPLAAPQGLYPCADDGPTATDKWLALSIATDEQWRALKSLLGDPDWAMDPALDTRAGRRTAHDAIDAAAARMDARARARRARRRAACARHPCLRGRQPVQAPPDESPAPRHAATSRPREHPVVGAMPLPSLPFRTTASIAGCARRPRRLGQHNEHVLCGILGLSHAELRELEAAEVIGKRPSGL